LRVGRRACPRLRIVEPTAVREAGLTFAFRSSSRHRPSGSCR
jgi:hypothetical protein